MDMVDLTTGVVVALMAYERYVAVCYPFDFETVLSRGKRKLYYSILGVYLIIVLFVRISEELTRLIVEDIKS